MYRFMRNSGWLNGKLKRKTLTVVAALALCLGSFVACSRVEVPDGKPAPGKPEPKPNTEVVVHERKLPSGSVCRVELRGAINPEGIAPALQSLSILITNREVHVPGEAFSDLTNVNVRQGVGLAEFAGDTFLLLSGGQEATNWQAKLIIRDLRVVGREFWHPNEAPTVVQYLPEPTLSKPRPLTTNRAVSIHISEPQTLPRKSAP